VASSKAHRLKPDAIDIRVDFDPIHWFLNGKDDTRSSYYLEDAATEFQVQGLEFDWVCITWDGDLRRNSSKEGRLGALASLEGIGWFHDFLLNSWKTTTYGEPTHFRIVALTKLPDLTNRSGIIF